MPNSKLARLWWHPVLPFPDLDAKTLWAERRCGLCGELLHLLAPAHSNRVFCANCKNRKNALRKRYKERALVMVHFDRFDDMLQSPAQRKASAVTAVLSAWSIVDDEMQVLFAACERARVIAPQLAAEILAFERALCDARLRDAAHSLLSRAVAEWRRSGQIVGQMPHEKKHNKYDEPKENESILDIFDLAEGHEAV